MCIAYLVNKYSRYIDILAKGKGLIGPGFDSMSPQTRRSNMVHAEWSTLNANRLKSGTTVSLLLLSIRRLLLNVPMAHLNCSIELSMVIMKGLNM